MAATRLIPMHLNKGKSLSQCLRDRTDYAQNPEKTKKGELVTSYECDPMTCNEEFLLSKYKYEHITGRHPKNDIIAYQIRQSFTPGEITPEEANEIGRELALRFTKGNYAFIVATHTDRAHIHNHIIFNSTSLDCSRKFRNFYLSSLALARCSDQICMEHQLSVIERRPYHEQEHRYAYPKNKTMRDGIREDIDAALANGPENFEELIRLLEEKGYEYKGGTRPSLKGPNQQRFARFDSLGEGYSVDELSAVINGEDVHNARDHAPAGADAGNRQVRDRSEISFLIDVQEKMRQGKSAGYAQWAKVFNVKQMAKAVLFLQEQGITSFEDLSEKTKENTARKNHLLASLRADEKQLKEINELRRHVINYSRAAKTFAAYKSTGYSREFFEEHRELLTLRRAAKTAFDEYEKTHGKGCRPKVRELNAEYDRILRHKKQVYAEYSTAKEDVKKWQTVYSIVKNIMNEEPAQEGRTERRQSFDID